MSRRAWIAASAGCVMTALAITAFTGFLVRDPDPVIHVRWRESVDAAERAALERRFHLHPVNQVAPTTWRYEVTDTSRENLGDLVGHPGVDDTHFVDRARFALQPDAPQGARRPTSLGERWPAFAFGLVDYGPLALLALAAGAALFAARPHLATDWAAVLTRGIPELSPRGLAAFRLVYGIVLAMYTHHPFPSDVVPRHLQRADMPLINVEAIQWLAAHPEVVRVGQWVAIASATLFAVGLWPRLFHALAVAGIVQWLLAFSLQADSHQFGVLLFPLIALLAVPWHHAPPLTRILRDDDALAGLRSRRYGFAPWLLSFALGVAWLGAAWAKVREGPGWVLNGTVRYHFISDYSQARVDWGLAVATMPRVAILLSAGAVLVEGLVIATAFLKMPMLRLALGAAAMALLTGFHLFQGILWPAWWLLLLGFLPWHWFDKAGTVAGQQQPSTVSAAQLVCIVALALQQIAISAAFTEFPPFTSRYDMYSKTHGTPADYDRENPGIERHIVAVDDRGTRTDLTDCAAHLDPPVEATLLLAEGADSPSSTAALKACHHEGTAPEEYLLLESQCLFDWNAGRFYCTYRDKLLGTLPASN